MYFINKEHEKFFRSKIRQAIIKDTYSKSLIYLLSRKQETRKNFEEIYDINLNEINIETLKKPWQTTTSINTCRFAFNLFGDITTDTLEENTAQLYTVTAVLKNLDINCCIQAIKLRFLKNYEV